MLENTNFELLYSIDQKLEKVIFDKPQNNSIFEITLNKTNNQLKVSIVPHHKITLKSFKCSIPFKFEGTETLWANGFQSWTETKQWSANDKISRFNLFCKLINPIYKLSKYGDVEIFEVKTRKGQFYGFDLAYIRYRNDKTLLFKSNITPNFYTIFFFDLRVQKIDVYIDVENTEIVEKTIICDFDVIETIFSDLQKFILFDNKQNNVVGWTSWYYHYQNINETVILKNLDTFSEFYPQGSVFQIDDGYQTAVGQWLDIDSNKFPNGLTPIVEKINQRGYLAGLWLAPTAVQKNSELVKLHPQWFVKDSKNRFIYGGINWGGFYILDIFNNEVQNYLRKVFDTILNQWNFDLLKLDFLYSSAIYPRNGMSRAAIMNYTMRFLRDLAGNKKILGCGVPLFQSAGLVDYCRIGADIGLTWNGKLYEKWLMRERVSTYNSLNNTISRYFLNNKLFGNDPDVFILRDENNSLNYQQKITTYLINSIFGCLVFTSDDFATYTDSQKQLLRNLKFFTSAVVNTYNSSDDLISFEFEIDKKLFSGLCNLSSKPKTIDLQNVKILDIYNLTTSIKTLNTITPFQTIIYER